MAALKQLPEWWRWTVYLAAAINLAKHGITEEEHRNNPVGSLMRVFGI